MQEEIGSWVKPHSLDAALLMRKYALWIGHWLLKSYDLTAKYRPGTLKSKLGLVLNQGFVANNHNIGNWANIYGIVWKNGLSDVVTP